MHTHPTKKQILLAEGILAGKSNSQAARDAGYSESSIPSVASRLPINSNLAPLLEKRRQELKERAQIHTDEITGALGELAFAPSPVEMFPHSKVMRLAKKRGLDRAIRKVSVRYKQVGKRTLPDGTIEPVIKEEVDVEFYSKLDAILQLRDNFGMKQEPRSNTFEETRRQEVEKHIERIATAEGVDNKAAAKLLKEALGPDSPLLPTVNKYIH